jgi:hypothetical protein
MIDNSFLIFYYYYEMQNEKPTKIKFDEVLNTLFKIVKLANEQKK